MTDYQGGKEATGVGSDNGETRRFGGLTASRDKVVPSSDMHSLAESWSASSSVVETSLECQGLEQPQSKLTKGTTEGKPRPRTLEVRLELVQGSKNSEDHGEPHWGGTSSPKHGPDSPACPSLAMSGNDIEMVYLASPAPAGTCSTHELLPPSDEHITPSNDVLISHIYSGSTVVEKENRASFKPFPLKWPLQALILSIIVGFFVLLEYEIRILPDPNFTPLDIARPDGRSGSNPIDFNKDEINNAAPVPEPNPRPPESAYPSPGPFTLYCGWGQLNMRAINLPAATPMPWAPWQASFFQYLPTFITDNPSWCPCDNAGAVWGDPWTTEKGWETADETCKIIMEAILLFNMRGLARASTDVFRPPAFPIQYVSATEAVNGDILMPLTSMTVPARLTAPAADVYGHTVGPAPSSGLFLAVDAPPKQDLPEDVMLLEDILWFTIPGSGGIRTAFPTMTITSAAPSTTMAASSAPSIGPGSSFLSSVEEQSSSHTSIAASESAATGTSFTTKSTARHSSTTLPPASSPSREEVHSSGSTTSRVISTSHGSHVQSQDRATSSKAATTDEAVVITSTIVSTSIGEQSEVTSIIVITTVLTSTMPDSDDQLKASSTKVSLPHTTEDGWFIIPSSMSTTPTGYVYTYVDSKGLPVLTVTSPPLVPLKIYTDSSSYRTWTTYPNSDEFNPATELPCYEHGCKVKRPPAHPEPGPIAPEAQGKLFNLRTEADYMAVSILPALLATLLGIPIQILVSSISCLLPFRALTRPTRSGQGVSARDSLLLPRTAGVGALNLQTPAVCYRFLRYQSDPLPLLTTLLNLLATILVPLSSETIRLQYAPVGKCFAGEECPIGLRKTEPCARAAEGILVVMAVILVTIMGILVRWWRRGPGPAGGTFGMATDPWSMASMATLLASSHQRVRDRFVAIGQRPDSSSGMAGKRYSGNKELQLALNGNGNTFIMGYYCPDHGNSCAAVLARGEGREGGCILKYGISAVSHFTPKNRPRPGSTCTEDNWGKNFDKGSIRLTTREITPPKRSNSTTPVGRRKSLHNWWSKADFELIIRLLFLVLLVGLLTSILYYETTLEDSAFERFMNSQSFGVRLLFTTLGTIVSLFWDYYFCYVSEHQLFRRLAEPQPAQRSILIPLPSSVFTSLWQFISGIPSLFSSRAQLTKHDVIAFNVALATLLAKFTPILFSAIPFRNTITWKMHEACTWTSVAFLTYMLLVLLATSLSSSAISSQQLKPQGRSLLWWKRPDSRSNNDDKGNLKGSAISMTDMPVGPPNTIAAYMYYICDSAMVNDFGDGLEKVGQKERDKLVMAMGKEYIFGEMVGAVAGEKRVGVDYAKAEAQKLKPGHRGEREP